MHRPRVGVCLVCWTTRGEGGSLRCSMGQVTWEEGGTEARGQEPSQEGPHTAAQPT